MNTPHFSQIHRARVQALNDKAMETDRSYVLYWMQQSQRAEWNHAFEYAVRLADELKQPLVVGFGITDDYPDANARHYTFMAEGLQELQNAFAERQCRLVIRRGSPDAVALELAKEAAAVVCDQGYLRHQRGWRRLVAREASCAVIQVESDAVVPVEAASGKQEYAARTIRRKLMGQFEEFLEEPDAVQPRCSSLDLDLPSLRINSAAQLVAELDIDHSVEPASEYFRGGASTAKARFQRFLDGRDCNSFANVAWLFGLHDRAWQERPVYGKVRIMTPGGLERKFNPQAYIGKVAAGTGAEIKSWD